MLTLAGETVVKVSGHTSGTGVGFIGGTLIAAISAVDAWVLALVGTRSGVRLGDSDFW